MEILTCGPVWRPNIRHHAKFIEDRSNHSRDMAICRFFKMAAVRHIGFLKVGNFNSWSGSKAQYESPCQISQRSVKPFRRYGDFSIFQDGGRSPYWICCRHIGITHEKYLVVSITVLNLVFNRCSSLDKVDVLMFCVFGLKAPIHSPKMWVLGGFDPLNVKVYY